MTWYSRRRACSPCAPSRSGVHRWLLGLISPELVIGGVAKEPASDPVAGFEGGYIGGRFSADLHGARAAGMESAAAGRRDQAGRVAQRLEGGVRAVTARVRGGGDEQLRVGVGGLLRHRLGRAALDDLSGVH